jgi:hypothetical protein
VLSPPCIRHRAEPRTAGARHGWLPRVRAFAPHRGAREGSPHRLPFRRLFLAFQKLTRSDIQRAAPGRGRSAHCSGCAWVAARCCALPHSADRPFEITRISFSVGRLERLLICVLMVRFHRGSRRWTASLATTRLIASNATGREVHDYSSIFGSWWRASARADQLTNTGRSRQGLPGCAHHAMTVQSVNTSQDQLSIAASHR